MSAVGNFFHKLWGGIKKAEPVISVGLNIAGAIGVPGTSLAAKYLTILENAVDTAEETVEGPGKGSIKAVLAQTDFLEQASLNAATEILKLRGENLEVDRTILQRCIDLKVTISNAAAELKDLLPKLVASFHTVKIETPPAK